MGKLSEKQRRFADEYIISGTAYSSAIKAGYSETYAKTDSHKLLENTRIKQYIDKRLNELKSNKVADQQEIMEFLTSVIRGEVKEPVAILDGDGKQKVEYLIPTVNVRRSAAVDLGKRYAMWTDNKNIDIQGSVSFIDDIGEDNEA